MIAILANKKTMLLIVNFIAGLLVVIMLLFITYNIGKEQDSNFVRTIQIQHRCYCVFLWFNLIEKKI